ncbi:BrnA antitoxin family protein [Castellaniella hirudinis]|uniref:BrnA antitoxin family protein n=1 Tax=Castellaniella hirudinis TaxID=1144617 RepID=UPI0039C12403
MPKTKPESASSACARPTNERYAAMNKTPEAPVKVQVTIRFDPDVLEGLRTTGKGWQTRANDVLREWLRAHRV